MKNLTPSSFSKFGGNEGPYVLKALGLTGEPTDSGNLSWTERFERAFCEKLHVHYAIACNSGTSGLHAALFAAGVSPGDEVIIPALTVVMDAYVVIHLGGIPVFVDVDKETYTIDPNKVEEKITPRTKAIITVSLQGLSCDMDPIMEIAKKHNIFVIDDSCQTLMGRYKECYAGTIAHLSVFSFENKKHLTTGSEGGMVVSNDEILATKVRKFAGLGYRHLTATAGRTHLALSSVQDPNYLRFDTVGLNYRMNTVSSAIGLAQLERADDITNMRKRIGQMFLKAVDGSSWLIPQKTPKNYEHSYYTFAAAYLGDQQHKVSWKEFYNLYIQNGGDGFYGACMIPYLEPALRHSNIDTKTWSCPTAETLQKQLMQFKTNYRDIDTAKEKIQVLSDLIDSLGR